MNHSAAPVVIALCVLCACSSSQQNQAQQSVKSGLLVAEVGAKLAAIDVDAPASVHIAAHGSVITLSGEAHNAKERAQYNAAARSASGVTGVTDRLTINPNLRGTRRTLADAGLTAKVAAAIAAQAGMNVFHVKTSARDGVVTLSGTVSSMAIKQTVVSAAKSTSGVEIVIDHIQVGR